MGRHRTVNMNLPLGMRARVRPNATYYYLDIGEGGREIALGKDYVGAVRKWAELKGGNASPRAAKAMTFRHVAEQYLASPKFASKAPRTQKDNLGELGKLYLFFDAPGAAAVFEDIKPHNIAQFRDWRKSTHSTHEIALVSAMWAWAREQGITSLANPTTGVERNKGKGRDVYVDDALYARVYAKADQPTQDAMDLALLAAQRPGDNLKMTKEDIKFEQPGPNDPTGWEGRVLYVQQGQTGARLRVRIIGRLSEVIARILDRKDALGLPAGALCVNEKGKPLTASALDARFGKARELAGVKPLEFQMRDLRAKAGAEVYAERGPEAAQGLLGHAQLGMTSRYVGQRLHKRVEPTH